MLEERLTELVATAPTDPFAEENALAVAAYNARITEAGAFSDEHRSF